MTETALVTGATAGIGAEFAAQLAARGCDLVLVARDVERLEESCDRLAKQHGVDAACLVADLTVRADVDRVAERVADDASPIDVLVNNAGFGLTSIFADSTIDDEQRQLDIHVTAPMRLAHAALLAMLERRHGRIINVASVAGYTPRGTYGAHKAWLLSFSQWANIRYASRGVTVTAVAAGFTRTEFHQRMNARIDDIPRWMWLSAPRLVSEALADADRGKAVSIPSKRYKVLSALAKHAPQAIVERAARRGR